MRRNMAIARDYAFRRQAFGSDLSNNLLHLQTLADMEIEYRGALQFLLHVIHLFGASETKKSSPEDTGKANLFIYLFIYFLQFIYFYYFLFFHI